MIYPVYHILARQVTPGMLLSDGHGRRARVLRVIHTRGIELVTDSGTISVSPTAMMAIVNLEEV